MCWCRLTYPRCSRLVDWWLPAAVMTTLSSSAGPEKCVVLSLTRCSSRTYGRSRTPSRCDFVTFLHVSSRFFTFASRSKHVLFLRFTFPSRFPDAKQGFPLLFESASLLGALDDLHGAPCFVAFCVLFCGRWGSLRVVVLGFAHLGSIIICSGSCSPGHGMRGCRFTFGHAFFRAHCRSPLLTFRQEWMRLLPQRLLKMPRGGSQTPQAHPLHLLRARLNVLGGGGGSGCVGPSRPSARPTSGTPCLSRQPRTTPNWSLMDP